MVSCDIKTIFTNDPLSDNFDIICQLGWNKNDPNVLKGKIWNG